MLNTTKQKLIFVGATTLLVAIGAIIYTFYIQGSTKQNSADTRSNAQIAQDAASSEAGMSEEDALLEYLEPALTGEASEVHINIYADSVNLVKTEVVMGSLIEWFNYTDQEVTVTSTDGQFSLGPIKPKEHAEHLLWEPGEYTFKTSHNPEIQTVVVVLDPNVND